jgi:hypothetical protein
MRSGQKSHGIQSVVDDAWHGDLHRFQKGQTSVGEMNLGVRSMLAIQAAPPAQMNPK